MAKLKAKTKVKAKTDYMKVRKMLKSLNDGEYRYLRLTMGFVNGIKDLIQNHKLDKKRFCELFRIDPKIYNDYTKGNYNYSIKDMVSLEFAFMELETKKLEKKVPVQLAEHNNNNDQNNHNNHNIKKNKKSSVPGV